MTTQTNGAKAVLSRPGEVPSTERGAWTCQACGFRGFWEGGAHCMGRELEGAFAFLEQRARAIGYPWGD